MSPGTRKAAGMAKNTPLLLAKIRDLRASYAQHAGPYCQEVKAISDKALLNLYMVAQGEGATLSDTKADHILGQILGMVGEGEYTADYINKTPANDILFELCINIEETQETERESAILGYTRPRSREYAPIATRPLRKKRGDKNKEGWEKG